MSKVQYVPITLTRRTSCMKHGWCGAILCLWRAGRWHWNTGGWALLTDQKETLLIHLPC